MSQDHGSRTLTCYAPGKAVLAGEYAVLAGAPSLVMAVNRYARCSITPNTSNIWSFNSSGFTGRSEHTLDSLARPADMASADPARLLSWVLATVPANQNGKPTNAPSFEGLPKGAEVVTDTQDMFESELKLGLGSSAALITALTGCVSALRGDQPPTFETIHRAHQASQGGIGSGLDVATSLAGGVIRFQSGEAEAAHWPADLHYRFVYSGKPAQTSPLVQRFNAWRESAQNDTEIEALTALFDASATLANTGINLDNLHRYIQALRDLDGSAGIGIYTSEHRQIASIAERYHLLYKPCGAGGGDLGVAIGDSEASLNRFASAIATNFAVIDLEIAANGLIIG